MNAGPLWAALVAEDPEAEAWTVPECEARLKAVTAELVAALRDRRDLGEKLGLVIAQYTRAKNRLHLRSKIENPDFTIPDHEAWAEVMIQDEYDDVGFDMRILKERQLAVNKYINGLQTIVEILRSHLKTAREIS